MRDPHHLPAGSAEPQDVVSAVDGNASAEEDRRTAGGDAGHTREALYNRPTAPGKGRRWNQWWRLIAHPALANRPDFFSRIRPRLELLTRGDLDAAVGAAQRN